MGTIILPCTCKDEFQDRHYGKGMRVHNVGGKGKEKNAYCTVCSPSQQRELRHYTPTIAAPLFGVTYTGIYGKKPERGAKRV